MHAQTRRQREVLDFITRYIDSHGYRPSYQVIARHMGVSSRAGIARIVHDLEDQGLLTRRRENGHFYLDVGDSSGSNGGITLEWLEVPVEGPSREPWSKSPFTVPAFLLGAHSPEKVRAFLVPDDEMRGENICEDDIALIELRQFPRDGERVAAVVSKRAAVLRKYYRSGSNIELHASTGEKDPDVIRLPADQIEVKGVFRGLIRPAV
jgi:repressor LexA